MAPIIPFLLSSAIYFTPAFGSALRSRVNDTMVFGFDKITPSTELRWTPCYTNFTCALLTVPLDYEIPSAGTTNIAFIKKQSSNSSAQDIIINPGGPSNSGTDFVLKGAPLFEKFFGSQYNLIGFDPRGVNNSGPLLTCFPSSVAAQNVFGRTLGLPVDANSSLALAEAYEIAGGWGEWCTRTNEESGEVRYANTPAVAGDLLRFVEMSNIERGQRAEDAKLWYYGLSYGSIIGTTFAALYPDRVGRMILDAPMDMDDWYSGQYRENLHDADVAVKSFFTYCHAAGKDKCAFYAESPEAIETRFMRVLDDIKENPLIVTDPYFVQMPTLATYKTLQSFVLQAVFAPLTRFPSFAQQMLALEKRNGTALAKGSGFGNLATECKSEEKKVREYMMEEPRLMITCNDANGRSNLSTFDQYREQVDYLVDQSFFLGESWVGATGMNCRNLDIRAPESQVFDGTVPQPLNSSTSPILFLANEIDPTSPLQGAQRMVSQFPGSGLVTVNGVGHGTITAPSMCTLKHVRAYLADGIVPRTNATCQPDSVPFIGSDGGWGKVLKTVF